MQHETSGYAVKSSREHTGSRPEAATGGKADVSMATASRVRSTRPASENGRRRPTTRRRGR
ncbi:hypothetical protein L665_03859 [Ralstonia solanacearum SD54]|nr:hypothetical protein L665_03859 [Ralstonia solanacearum SD54]